MARLTALVALLCALAPIARAEDAYTDRTEIDKLLTFQVTGYGKQFFAVDMADVVFSVTARNRDARKAKTAHDEAIAKIKEYIGDSDFKGDRIQLTSTELKREQDIESNSRVFVYECKSTFAMRTPQVDQLAEFQAGLVEHGVDEIVGVTLFSSKQRDQEDEAKKLAIADAKRKAALTVKELDWTLGKITAVQYQESRWSYQAQGAGFGTRGGGGRGVSEENLAGADYVESTVTLTFGYTIK